MTGFTAFTFLAVFAGLVVHSLKQLGAARGTALTPRAYVLDHWPELSTGGICGLVLWAGSPELAHNFPDLAHAIGVDGSPTIVSSFACGYVGNTLADLLGARVKAVAGSL